MARTDSDVLAGLRLGGVLPTFWRRRRATAKWHRGFRLGPQVVHSQCDKIAGLHKGNLLFAPIEEPWPEPHCPGCERGTPGTRAVRDYVSEGLDVRFVRRVGATPDEARRRLEPPTPNNSKEE